MTNQRDLMASECAMQRIAAAVNSGQGDFDVLQSVRETVNRWVVDPRGLANELNPH